MYLCQENIILPMAIYDLDGNTFLIWQWIRQRGKM